MTDMTAAILADPHPKAHIVYPYSGVENVSEAVTWFIAATTGVLR